MTAIYYCYYTYIFFSLSLSLHTLFSQLTDMINGYNYDFLWHSQLYSKRFYGEI